MPFRGNYPYAGPLTPSIQVSTIDGTSTLTGDTSLSTTPGYVTWTTASGSVELAPIAMSGHSTVTISGTTLPVGAFPALLEAEVRILLVVTLNGMEIIIDDIHWRQGETTFYETYRVTGESVTARISLDSAPYDPFDGTTTGYPEITVNLFVFSV